MKNMRENLSTCSTFRRGYVTVTLARRDVTPGRGVTSRLGAAYLRVDVACDPAVFLVGQFDFDPLQTGDQRRVLREERPGQRQLASRLVGDVSHGL